MCLGFPGLIEKLELYDATVDIGGTKRQVSTIFLGDTVGVGDWVMVHAGFAMAKMDEKEAKETLKFLEEAVREYEESQ
ncbi:MAG: HypC/HybG/HupF family hydrogenase formation chaperone [Deferribacterales bacterium]|nr:HypC/HybG/HupF family hydrogenase formation chaperone [Deferribacterales bacterium]